MSFDTVSVLVAFDVTSPSDEIHTYLQPVCTETIDNDGATILYR